MRRRAILLGAACAATLRARVASAQGAALTDGSFQREVVGVLKRHHPDWRVEVGGDPQGITVNSGKLFLGNLYARVAQMPAAVREPEILAFAENGTALAAQGPASYAASEAKLRLQIVPAEYLRAGPGLVSRPFMPGLLVAYTVDDEKAYRIVLEKTLADWHVDRAAVERRATENAEAVAEAIRLEPRPNGGGGAFLAVMTSDGYDAARLLLPRFMARARAALGSAQVFAAIPNRDALIVWSPDFAKRREFAARVSQDARERPHPLTAALFVSSAQGVRPMTTAELADHGRPA